VWPRIATRARLVLVPHVKEWRQSSNTGRVAVMTLRHAELAVWGRRAAPLEPSLLLRPGHRHVLLHPGEDAAPLAPTDARPVRLIVPDGTWRQSGRIAKRLAALPGVGRARLALRPTAGLRRAPAPDRVHTGEAIAAALERLGEPRAAAALRDAVRRLVDRTLWVRGQLPAARVRGGVPIALRRAMSGHGSEA
jgi:DTW domain-containing protein YfiP